MVELRAHETRLLATLQKLKGKASVEKLTCETKLTDAAVMRSALTLQEKVLIRIHAELQTIIRLTAEGESHAKNGLPDRRLINAVVMLGRKTTLDKAAEKAGLEKRFVQIALGWTQRKKWLVYDSKTNTLSAAFQPEEEVDEKLLHRLLSCPERLTISELNDEEKTAAQTLKKRQLLTTADKTTRILEITDEGKAALQKGTKATEEVTQLTPELVITGKWRKTKFQEYNIEAPVTKTWPGKKHPYLSFLEVVREKLVTLGFKEMKGTNVETSFFNFDALYTPQDHPAREASGIYYVKCPEYGDTSKYKTAVEHVKKTHENGWKTGSTGWGYVYSTQEIG